MLTADRSHPGHRPPLGQQHELAAPEDGMAKDPICGMVVPRATAPWAEQGARRYWFCSEGCRRNFLDPERELRQMRRRMGIAISGVLLLAGLRVAVDRGERQEALLHRRAKADGSAPRHGPCAARC
ncbi:MAG: hypothetical protein WBN89_15615 [Prochlorococcaceae cyanobacterium]